MNKIKLLSKLVLIISITLLVGLKFCCPKDDDNILGLNTLENKTFIQDSLPYTIKVNRDIVVEHYFEFMDSLVEKYDFHTPYNLTEHLLVRSNYWILDKLQNTDYYIMKALDSFVYNQKEIIVLPKNSFIKIPDSISASKLINSFKNTLIDVNIPEFKLRIYEDSVRLYEFLIRVGRHEKKYLKMSGRVEDLRTKTGTGIIVNFVKNPRYVNPVNNHQYLVTRRDDKKVTKLPKIPFLETKINGVKNGQLIHPTTNPITLGKAYSNGCIGTREADAWVIYYYAPIDTKIKIRYDLMVINENGETKVLEDIYRYAK